MECTGSVTTGQIEELKLLVSERLSAIASEIVTAIARTIAEYEAQAVRLKEENDRHRSLLDVILKTSLPKRTPAKANADHVVRSDPAASGPPSHRNSAAAAAATGCLEKTSPAAGRTPTDPAKVKFSFTSCDDFLAYGTSVASGECPYCINPCVATEKHLMLKHYKGASRFLLNGIEHFVVPCMCKERIQGTKRSHWHCTLCHKTIARKRNFDMHISKMHGIALLQNSQEAVLSSPSETDQSPVDEQAPLSSDSWCQKAGSRDQESQQAFTFLHIKEEEEEEEGQQVEKDTDPTRYTQPEACVGSADPSTQLDVRTRSPEEKNPPSVLKSLGPKRRRPLPKISNSAAARRPPLSSANHGPAGPHQCKACGKRFHYMYTLRTHVQAHRLDGVCGICGRRLGRGQSLLQHLQNHRRRKKCGICGKQFSDDARLRRHSAFHRPKALSAMSASG